MSGALSSSLLTPLTCFIHARHISDTPASEREFQENLRDLDHKLKFLNEQTFYDYRSVYDVHDVLAKLSIKVDRKQEREGYSCHSSL